MTGLPTLTLHQPWASLIALGAKTIETRSWSTKYRGRIGIHAAKREPDWNEDHEFSLGGWLATIQDDEPVLYPPLRVDDTHDNSQTYWPLPLGALVATAELVDVVPICRIEDEELPPCVAVGATDLTLWEVPDYWHHESDEVDISHQLPFGDFTPGRFAWLLDDIKPTTERCPACWGDGLRRAFNDSDQPSRWGGTTHPCPTCDGAGHCPPIPAKGKQGLWKWTP